MMRGSLQPISERAKKGRRCTVTGVLFLTPTLREHGYRVSALLPTSLVKKLAVGVLV